MELFALRCFRAPFVLADFSARAVTFFALAGAFAADFLGAAAVFFAGLCVFALAADALGRAVFFARAFGFTGFFGAFFLWELAIFSVAPLVSGRKRRLN